MHMAFEFDQKKSESNRLKHGIDFVGAQALWDDPDHIVGPADSLDEERYVAVGTIGGVHWAVIYTVRGSAIRIISCRPTQGHERQAYEDGK